MDLSRVLDLDRPVTLPPRGLVVGERVAQILNLRRGDVVEVEILEGRRGDAPDAGGGRDQELFRPRRLHGHRCARHARLRGAADRGAHLLRCADQDDLFTAIKSTPGIGSIALQRHALARFRETIAQNINYSVTIYVALAAIIAFGVVYNSARIQLSEHARELASLQGAGLHQGGGLARAADRARTADAACDPLGLADRLRLRLAADPGLLQRPLSRALRHRACDLRQSKLWSCWRPRRPPRSSCADASTSWTSSRC